MIKSKQQLIEILNDIVKTVENDDSFEGRIQYSCLNGDCKENEFEVECFYRVGNSQGQGGGVLIEPSVEKENDYTEPDDETMGSYEDWEDQGGHLNSKGM